MKLRARSPTGFGLLGVLCVLFVLFAVRCGDVFAAPVSGTGVMCPQGTDETGRMLVWYVLDGKASLTRWYARPYIVHLPGSYDGTVPFPVVIDLHGGGGTAEGARAMTCPNGNLNDPGCLDRLADCEGFITVYPSGTSDPVIPSLRTFDAGGGAAGFQCVSGVACTTKVDDLRYFTDLLDTLEKTYTIDPARIYLTGLSDGGAMSHRLACELSDRIAAIAPISGGNQFAALEYCSPTRAVAVLEIHGTADRCWPYQGGLQTCAGVLTPRGFGGFVPIPATVAAWAATNMCRPTPLVENLPDIAPTDGTSVTRISYRGCANGGDVVQLRINGGGHTWPGGSSVLPIGVVGNLSREFSANKVIWEFFKAHPMRWARVRPLLTVRSEEDPTVIPVAIAPTSASRLGP
jgi:polyhydroxybutyrate depolymerase